MHVCRVVENVKMRSHVQATRYWVFAVIDALLAHHRDGESPQRLFARSDG
jgi:hypothetical protein